MKEIPIELEKRTEVGKGFARRARMAGLIPGVMYGPEVDPIAVAVQEREFRAAMKSATSSTILNLHLDGKETRALAREMQRDPVTNRVLHIDFHAIDMNKPIDVKIPIRLHGSPIGVKVDGGIMQTTMRELEISCLPANIPDTVDLDVSELAIGDSIHVRDLELADVDIVTEEQRTIVVISAPTVIKATEDEAAEGEELEGEEGAEGEGEEGAEGAAAEGEGDKKADDAKTDEKK